MKRTLTLIFLILFLQPLKSICQEYLPKTEAKHGSKTAGRSGVTGSKISEDQIAMLTGIKGIPGLPYSSDVKLKRLTSLFQLDSLKAAQMTELLKQSRLKKLMLQNERRKMTALMKINNLDTLKRALNATTDDTLQALLYSRIALKYMNLDTAAHSEKRYYYQNKALDYTLQAIRKYSVLNDSTGLRLSYDNLAKVYHEQKKYTQAKWFILQSNTLAREQKDTADIITSLLTLAAIKSDIKDYGLAMRDLDEALELSITTHTTTAELSVLKNYAGLYNRLRNYKKEALVLKKRDSLLDRIRRAQAEQLAKAALQKKRFNAVQKKKLYSYAPGRDSNTATL